MSVDAHTKAPVTEALWTSAEAQQATGGRVYGRWTASGVAIDSRELLPGDLFVALVDARDGHDFVSAAFDAGASAALVARSHGERPGLMVEDTLEGLRKLGAAARDRCPAVRVAVTGSVGKTSVKEALASVFRRAGPAHASTRSFNNHWGVPLTLARMPRTAQRAVFELGMNHAGEIRRLTAQVKPDVALITKIAPAHLENLGSMEAIADAKAEIFEGLANWGAAIIPGDDDFAARLAERAGAAGAGWLCRFGTDRQAEARLISFERIEEPDLWAGEAEIFGRPVSFRMRALGPHAGLNAAAVLAAAYLADTPLDLAASALADAAPGAGRGALGVVTLPGGGAATLIDDSYNANPASVAAALHGLAGIKPGPGGRRIAVLGDMLELGPEEARLHADLARPVEEAGVDLVFSTGERMQALHEALPESRRGGWASGAREQARAVLDAVRPGDVVLVKGSNGSHMARVVEALKAGRAD